MEQPDPDSELHVCGGAWPGGTISEMILEMRSVIYGSTHILLILEWHASGRLFLLDEACREIKDR
jgi:hypothetical protein